MKIKKILLTLIVLVFMFAICINSKTIAAKSDNELCTVLRVMKDWFKKKP